MDSAIPSMALPAACVRIGAYLAISLLAAMGTMCRSMSLGGIGGDEAIYAQSVDNMIETGDWLSPTPLVGTPYFQKPPLQIWLTGLTYHLLPDVMRYRFWPAVFGIVSVGLLCVMAGKILSPEIGLVAALLLATNHYFLFEHGVRHGVFDAGVVFFLLAMMAIYAWLAMGDARPRWTRTAGWIVMGVAAGLAGMLKPLVGLPLLALLAMHTFTMPRARWGRHLVGLTVAAALSLAVMAPWFVAMTLRWGEEFPRAMLWRNIAERGTMGLDPRHFQSALYYLRLLYEPGRPFVLVWPAAAFAVLAAVFGMKERQIAWRLVAIVGIGWVAVFSISASKTPQYVHPALPVLAICVAGLVDWGLRRTAALMRSLALRRGIIVGGWAVATIFLMRDAAFISLAAAANSRGNPMWEVYQSLAGAIDQERVRLVFSGFPGSQPLTAGDRALVSTDLFYLRRMTGGVRCDGGMALAALLAERRPTLLVWSRLGPPPDLDALTERIDERFSVDALPYSVRLIDARPLVEPPVSCAQPTFETALRLSLSSCMTGAAFLELRVRLAETPESPVVCIVSIDGRNLSDNTGLVLKGNEAVFTANLPAGAVASGMRALDVQLRPLAGRQVVRGTFMRATMRIDPQFQNTRRAR